MADDPFRPVEIPRATRTPRMAAGVAWALLGAIVTLLAALAVLAVADARDDPAWMQWTGMGLGLGALLAGIAAIALGIIWASREH